MSVKKEASGRRSVQVEVEVPGTPEEVWQAIATGPGISSWFVPAEFEEKDGKPVAVKLNLGPGMESRISGDGLGSAAEVGCRGPMAGCLACRPSRTSGAWKLAEEASASSALSKAFSPARTNGTTSWKAPNHGWPGFLRTLRIYLTHFRGQRSAMMQWMAPAAGTEAEAWETLTAAVGVKGVSVGQRCTAPAGVPAFSGVVEYVTQSPNDALLRLDKPGPGVAALGTFNMGGPSMVALNFYLYGDQAAGTVAHETPLWDAWFQKRFPMPTEPSKSE